MPQGPARLFTALCFLVALVAVVLVNQGNPTATGVVEGLKGFLARIRQNEAPPTYATLKNAPPRQQTDAPKQDIPDVETPLTISEPDDDKDIPDMGDGAAQLETLGPIVVNTDGVSRVLPPP
jgi:hypothetical protein